MRTSFQFRSFQLGGNSSTELGWLCNVETGEMVQIHSTNTNQTAVQYYAYANQRYNGPGAENNTVLVRWHRNVNTKELSLIVVLQSAGTSTMGPVGIQVKNLNSSAYVSVSDDNNEVTKSGNQVNASLTWSSDRTDGFAISGIDSSIIPNLLITFDNPYNTMRLKIQTEPNKFVYIRQDKLTNMSLKTSDANACERYVYPDGQAFVVNTAAERTAATSASSAPPTPSQVFNQWGRYAGPNWYPSGTTPQGEAAAWVYDSSTNRIRCTVNSSNYIGFVSPETLSYYDLSTRVGSGNSDDDLIGVVVAFVVEDGVPSSICAVRSNGGSIGGRSWALVQIVANTWTLLVDGAASAPTTQKNGEPTNGTGWAGSAQTVIRVKRDNRQITVSCSQFGSDTISTPTTLTYKIPQGGIFDKNCSYGFMCQSQNDSYYDILSFKGGLDQSTVYDLTTTPPRVYEYNGTSWAVNANRSVFEELGQPRTVSNPSTGKSYYLDNNTITIVE